jgi:hypothetical protein
MVVRLLSRVTHQAPSDTRKRSSHARVPRGVDRAKVGAKGGASVEAEPAEPEHEGAEGDEGDVVRPEVDEFALATAAKDPGVGEATDAGADLDRTAPSIVEDAPLEPPAVDVPGPAGDGAVDEGDPEEAEDHRGHHTTALGDGAHEDTDGDGAELELEERVEEIGNERRAGRRAAEHVPHEGVVEVADVAIGRGRGEGERVRPEVPREDGDRVREDDSPDERERVLSTRETGVEEGEAGDHEQDAGSQIMVRTLHPTQHNASDAQSGREEDEGHIATIDIRRDNRVLSDLA